MGRILVTGGAGFIGSHVADVLLRQGHDVTVLDDLSGGFRHNVPAAATFVQGSIVDSGLVDELCCGIRFDYIFHCAAYAAEGLSHFIKRFNYINNVIGSVNLINAAVNTRVQTFVFTSSIAVYGTSDALPLTEDMPPCPEDSYGIAKHAVELELRASHELFGLNYVVFRPHNVYGPRQNIADPYRNVVGIFMKQIMEGRPMTIFGDGHQTRAFSYIDDVAPEIAAAIETPAALNQTFNIGCDAPCTLNALAQLVAHAMCVTPCVKHLEARHEVRHVYSAHEKARRVFGRRAAVPLDIGVARMARWVREHDIPPSQRFEPIEIIQNLPTSWL